MLMRIGRWTGRIVRDHIKATAVSKIVLTAKQMRHKMVMGKNFNVYGIHQKSE